jgi:hypothetical protein
VGLGSSPDSFDSMVDNGTLLVTGTGLFHDLRGLLFVNRLSRTTSTS